MVQVRVAESPIRARRRRRRALLIWGTWGFMMVLIGGAIVFSNASFVRVQTINIAGGKTVAAEALEARVREELRGSYLFLFPKDNIFLYPKEGLSAALLRSYPTLREVVVGAQDFTTLNIEARDREPRALWCGTAFESPGACLLLDEEGVAYAVAPEFSNNPYVRYYGELSGDELPKHLLALETFRSLAALVDAIVLHQKELPVVGVVVEQEDARLVFEGGFVLRFALEDDGGDVYERFTLALTAEPFKGRTLREFEYLDLRFGDKLYYKLKTESAPE